MKGYLLDATALVEPLRAAPSPFFVQRLQRVPTAQRWTSSVVVGELLYAARRTNDQGAMTNVLRLVSSIRVAPFDTAAARTYGKLAASAASAGVALSITDLMTISIARTMDLALVTRRPAVFRAIPQLSVEDWCAG